MPPSTSWVPLIHACKMRTETATPKFCMSVERIDQVIWREAERRYAVLTRDRGQVEFELSGDGGARDEYGAIWKWRGDLAALAAQVHDGTLEFTHYPNAFERIAASFDDRVSGDIWVTSRLGYEFQVTGTKVNRRGSHGSLHIDYSTSLKQPTRR